MHNFALIVSAPVVLLLLCGWAYMVLAWWCVRRRLATSASTSTLKLPPQSISPQAAQVFHCGPVSILKPLKGIDSDLLANLTSFATLEYPTFEILFGVADISDPAVAIVHQLQRDFPDRDIRLVVAPRLGMNPKSAILHALVGHAKYDLLALSDSDIHVQPDYLRRLVRPLCDSGVGLVTCMYVAGNSSSNPAGMLDALHIDQTFLPLVAVGSYVPGVRFAFGASIALRRSDLLRAGGYARIADHLADDYMVGRIVCDLGMKTQLADFTVAHSVADTSLKALWEREVRWARTIRVLEGRRYALMPVTFWIVWATLLPLIAGGAAWAIAMLAATILVRWSTALASAKLIESPRRRRELIWLPLRDLLDVAIWCAAWTGSRVTWRDVTYRLMPDGTLAALTTRPSVPTHQTPRFAKSAVRPLRRNPLAAPARGLIRWLDATLRAREGIFEYSHDPHCIFRIGIRRAPRQIDLEDGTIIEAGHRFIELHLWNERLAQIPKSPEANFAWGKAFQRRIARSLALLADYLHSRPDLRDAAAVFGKTAMVVRTPKQIRLIMRHFGFEYVSPPPSRGILNRLHDRGEDMLVRMLLWAFNPFGRELGSGPLPRHEIWISRRSLLDRYGHAAQADGKAERAAARSRRAARRARTFGRDAVERPVRLEQALAIAPPDTGVRR